jgi:hypothetical protein
MSEDLSLPEEDPEDRAYPTPREGLIAQEEEDREDQGLHIALEVHMLRGKEGQDHPTPMEDRTTPVEGDQGVRDHPTPLDVDLEARGHPTPLDMDLEDRAHLEEDHGDRAQPTYHKEDQVWPQ